MGESYEEKFPIGKKKHVLKQAAIKKEKWGKEKRLGLLQG